MLTTTQTAPAKGDNVFHRLTPSQQRAYDRAMAIIPGAAITVIKGEVGMGKSLVIAHLQAALGGAIYSLNDIIGEASRRCDGKLEEALIECIRGAFERDDIVFVEDITMLDALGNTATVDRPAYLGHVMAAMYGRITTSGKRLVVASAERVNYNDHNKAAIIEMDHLGAEDYHAVIANRAFGIDGNFDADKVARTFKRLTGYQITAAINLLQEEGREMPDAAAFIEMMDQVKSRSNLAVEDVEDITLDGLVGIEAVTRELMRTIVIPMSQPELARELGLKAARGVLLHGEPGTGKTTIGRALARQMNNKFFNMDGSTKPEAAGPLLEAAEASAPSVFFIDDADVIFKNGENSGFARKLLTKLDGLESESMGNVCIIMTAMDVADMPPAIVRSGRVEVWLHMEVPDAKKRADLIRHYAASLPEDMRHFDEQTLIDATAGFVPADLRGLVGDARGHIAYDRHKSRPVRSFEEYLLIAASEIWDRKMVIASLGGKSQSRPKLPELLRPPVCTDGICS